MKLFFLIFIFLSLPGFAQEDDEKLLEDLEAERKQQLEAHAKIAETQNKLTNKIVDLPGELSKLGYKTIDTAALMDEKVIELMRKALKQNPLQKSTPEEVRATILKQAEGSFIHGYLSESPKLMNALVDVLRDEKALPSAMGIFLRKDDLKIYFFIWLGFMILAWLFKKIFFNQKWPKHKRKILGILVSISFSLISVTTFYHMFYDELSPAGKILITHWRKRNL